MVLPKSMRLRGYKCFDYLHKEGIKFHSPHMLLRVAKAKPRLLNPNIRKSTSTTIRCGISISNKVSKKAVIRNKLRRLFHNHLNQRLAKSQNLCKNWAFISLKPNCLEQKTPNLLQECDKLLIKAGLIK